MTDTVESVLAEMREFATRVSGMYEVGQGLGIANPLREWADRLAAAHARDQRHYAEIERTWEWHKQTTIRAMTRAEVAEALLREALPYVATDDPGERAEVIALRTRIAAHLSGATD